MIIKVIARQTVFGSLLDQRKACVCQLYFFFPLALDVAHLFVQFFQRHKDMALFLLVFLQMPLMLQPFQFLSY